MIPAVAPDTLLLPVLFFLPSLLPPLFVSFLPSVLLFFVFDLQSVPLSLFFLSSSSLSLKGEAG